MVILLWEPFENYASVAEWMEPWSLAIPIFPRKFFLKISGLIAPNVEEAERTRPQDGHRPGGESTV